MGRNQDEQVEFTSPYNFVPLSGWVHFPHWDDLVSHDIPFADGVCGHIDIEIEAKTDIFTRGESNKEEFCNIDGHPFIKGTTLRGMLRNVVKIATFGKMNRVDERRFGIRDLSNADTTYVNDIRRAEPGFLVISDDEDGHKRYEILPCSAARVHRDKLERFHQEKTGARWDFRRLKGHGERNRRWTAPREVKATLAKESITIGGQTATAVEVLGTGEVEGTLVFFGFIPDDKKQHKEKKHSYFFYNVRDDQPLRVSASVWDDFVDAHSSSQQRPELGADGGSPAEAWEYWRDQLAREPRRKVPVYYIPGAGGVESFGLAKAYRRASKQSVHGSIKAVSKSHMSSARRDMAELMFGYVESELAPNLATDQAIDGDLPTSLRGRVSIGPAFSINREPPRAKKVQCLLAAPRASFNPSYLQAKNGKIDEWENSGARAAGWKRYPARGKISRAFARNEKREDLETTFYPLKAGVTFHARIQVHNLRAVELGALLWALDFGGKTELVHRIGMAKPYGFGEVSVRVRGVDLIPNDGSEAEKVSAYRERFVDYMSTAYPANLGSDWIGSEQLISLLAMADPTAGIDEDLVYPALKTFRKLKNKKTSEPHPEPNGKEAWRANMQRTSLQSPPSRVDDFEAHVAAREARLYARARAEEEAREASKKREALALLERQRDTWRAIPASQRVDAIIDAMNPQQALDFLKAHISKDAPIDGNEYESLFDLDQETRRSLFRRTLRQRYYELWSNGRGTDQVQAGASKLREYAAFLADPKAEEAVAERVMHSRPELAELEAAKAADRPVKELIKAAGNDAMENHGWSCEDLANLWQWVENEDLNGRRSKKKDKKWCDKLSDYIAERCKD